MKVLDFEEVKRLLRFLWSTRREIDKVLKDVRSLREGNRFSAYGELRVC